MSVLQLLKVECPLYGANYRLYAKHRIFMVMGILIVQMQLKTTYKKNEEIKLKCRLCKHVFTYSRKLRYLNFPEIS